MVWTSALAAVVNLGLNLALIPAYDEVGAALAMLRSTLVYVRDRDVAGGAQAGGSTGCR